MREIQLTKGYRALVEDADYAALSVYRWHAGMIKKGSNKAYAVRTEGRKTIAMHRQILGLTPNDGFEGDHENGNTLDNQRRNLRVSTRRQNKANERARRSSKPFIGVTPIRAKFRAAIKHDGANCHLGTFKTGGSGGTRLRRSR